MFRKFFRLLLVFVLIALIIGGCAYNDKTTDTGPSVAVLCDSSRSVETIDAKELKLLDSIKLRSLLLDFTLNPKNNMIYTAQCGLTTYETIKRIALKGRPVDILSVDQI